MKIGKIKLVDLGLTSEEVLYSVNQRNLWCSFFSFYFPSFLSSTRTHFIHSYKKDHAERKLNSCRDALFFVWLRKMSLEIKEFLNWSLKVGEYFD